MSEKRPIKKLYIEATSRCNLNCITCFRRQWVDEKPTDLPYEAVEGVLNEAAGMKDLETVFFGGIGEPLFHKRILDMVRKAKSTGKRVELITNGTLLNRKMAEELVDAGLDLLWISIDSIYPENFDTIREGATFEQIINALKNVREAREEKNSSLEIGMTFVAMKSNALQIANLETFARGQGISRVNISNLIPNTDEMKDEILYYTSLSFAYGDTGGKKEVIINYPLIDVREEFRIPLFGILRGLPNYRIMGKPLYDRSHPYCRFVQEGNVFIRSDGEVCPCMALLHRGKTYLYNIQRDIKAASFGSIFKSSLKSIWDDPKYVKFRNDVIDWVFPPCVACAGCEDLESNEKDCFDNEFPVCGGCLWAHDFVQCP